MSTCAISITDFFPYLRRNFKSRKNCLKTKVVGLSTGHANENRTIEQMNHHNGYEIVDRRLKNKNNVFLYLDEIFYNIGNFSTS